MELKNSINGVQQNDYSYFIDLNDNDKENYIKKLETVTKLENNEKSLSFKILDMNIPEKMKNELLKKNNIVESSYGEECTKTKEWLLKAMQLPINIIKGLDINKETNQIKKKKFLNKMRKYMDRAVYGHEEGKERM